MLKYTQTNTKRYTKITDKDKHKHKHIITHIQTNTLIQLLTPKQPNQMLSLIKKKTSIKTKRHTFIHKKRMNTINIKTFTVKNIYREIQQTNHSNKQTNRHTHNTKQI